MGMSSSVIGVRDLDSTFSKMMAVKKSCEFAGVGYPKEVIEYFPYVDESEEYLRMEMEEVDISEAVTKKQYDYTDCFELDITKLPNDVKIVRFKNSY